MKYFKIILLTLLLLALLQYLYFGVEHCDRCDFDGMSMNKFFDIFREDCLKSLRIEMMDELPTLNLTTVAPKKMLENLSYKNETKDL